jgi:hypothetical protein
MGFALLGWDAAYLSGCSKNHRRHYFRLNDEILTTCRRERELRFHINNIFVPHASTCRYLGRTITLTLRIFFTSSVAAPKKPIRAETPVQIRLDSILDIRIHCCSSRVIPMRQAPAQAVEAFQTRLEQLSEVVERFLGAHTPTAASCDKVVSHVLGLGTRGGWGSGLTSSFW